MIESQHTKLTCIFLSYFFLYFLCIYGGTRKHVCHTFTRRLGENLQKSVLCLNHVCSWDQTQATRLDGKCLFTRRLITSLEFYGVLFTWF